MGEEELEALVHYFHDLQSSEPASSRAVALTALHQNCYEMALKYCLMSQEQSTDNLNRFLTMTTLAQVYKSLWGGSAEEHEKNKRTAYDMALAALEIPLEWSSSDDVKRQRRENFILRAEYEVEMSEYGKAVGSYEAAKDAWPQSSGGLLSSVAKLLDEKNEYAALVSKVESWGLENRLYWLALTDPCEPYYSWFSANTMFQRAAALADTSARKADSPVGTEQKRKLSPSLASMINIYEEMIEYMRRMNHAACLRYELARAYRTVIGDDLAAKRILDTLLEGDSCYDPSLEYESKFLPDAIREDYSVIVFEQFQASMDAQEKIALLDEFENIPNRRLIRSTGIANMQDNKTTTMLARMIRKARSPHEFQAHMEKVFQACIATLSDSVSGNDQLSFYILAKLLMCIDGLQREAKIALSAQVSLVDKSLTYEDNSWIDDCFDAVSPVEPQSTSFDGGTAAPMDRRRASNEVPAGEMQPVNSPEGINTTADSKENKDNDDNDNDDNDDDDNDDDDDDNDNDDDKDNNNDDNSNAADDDDDDDEGTSEDGLDEAELESMVDQTQAEALLDQTQTEALLDQDLAEWAVLTCSGPCAKLQRDWTGLTLYTCLICARCDLCQECYDKRQALNLGDKSAHWRSFCGKDHEYVQAPIEGWKGVKDGVMTIGDKRIEFKVWLEELRDVTWKKAWAGFWKGG